MSWTGRTVKAGSLMFWKVHQIQHQGIGVLKDSSDVISNDPLAGHSSSLSVSLYVS